MTTAIRFTIRTLCALAGLAALALPPPAAGLAQDVDESEVRMPVDKNVLPLDFSRPPAERPEPKAEKKKPAAEKPAKPQKPAPKALPAKPPAKKAEEKKAEETKPAPAQAQAEKAPAQARPKFQKPKPAPAPAEKPAEGQGLVREVKLNVWQNGSVLKVATDRPAEGASAFAAASPKRLVLDLPGKWKSQAQSIYRFESGPIKAIRVGVHPDKVRVVVDFREDSGRLEAVPRIEQSEGGLSLTIPNP